MDSLDSLDSLISPHLMRDFQRIDDFRRMARENIVRKCDFSELSAHHYCGRYQHLQNRMGMQSGCSSNVTNRRRN